MALFLEKSGIGNVDAPGSEDPRARRQFLAANAVAAERADQLSVDALRQRALAGGAVRHQHTTLLRRKPSRRASQARLRQR